MTDQLDENVSLGENGAEYGFRHRRGPGGPPVRVFTWKQVAMFAFANAGLLLGLWKTVDGNLIDSRIAIHNHDEDAHSKRFSVYQELARAKEDRDQIARSVVLLADKLDAVSAQMADLRASLARIEGIEELKPMRHSTKVPR